MLPPDSCQSGSKSIWSTPTAFIARGGRHQDYFTFSVLESTFVHRFCSLCLFSGYRRRDVAAALLQSVCLPNVVRHCCCQQTSCERHSASHQIWCCSGPASIACIYRMRCSECLYSKRKDHSVPHCKRKHVHPWDIQDLGIITRFCFRRYMELQVCLYTVWISNKTDPNCDRSQMF